MDGGIERFPFVLSQNGGTRRSGRLPIDMREPEQAPGDDAHQCQVWLEALGLGEPTVFDATA